MKVDNRKRNDKETVKINIGVSILLAVVLSFISVGYAVYGQRLSVLGNVVFQNNQGVVAITDVTFVSASSYNSSANPAHTDDSVDFNLTFAKEQGTTHSDYRAVFEVTIDNDTYYDYEFNLANFQPVIQNSQHIDVDPSYLTVYLAPDGPQLGDSIPAGDSITFQIYMDFAPAVDDTYTVDGEMGTELEEQPHGTILGSIPANSTGDLRESLNKNLATFTVDVINSYQSSRTFTLSLSDPVHFQLVAQDGVTPLGSFTINEGDEQTFTFYVARVANAVYANSSYPLSVNLTYNEGTVNCGNITLLVDEAQVEDMTPPTISNLAVAIGDASSCDTSANNVGTVNLTWSTTIPDSGIDSFYVTAYNGDTNAVIDTKNAGKNCTSGTCSYTYTGLSTTTSKYYFQVYGVNGDGHGSTSNEISQYGATVNENTNYYWKYTVSLTGNTYMTTFNDGKVNRGCTYTGTLNAKTDDNSYYYYVATSSNNVTVTVGGTSIQSTTSDTETKGYFKYTPSSNNNPTSATIKIYKVDGTVNISVTGTRSQKNSGGC